MTPKHDLLIVKGAREHNLRDVYVEIPKGTLTVFCGVSGSGKSSLAFDTIYAEGQRRYVESLSAYARQFLGQMEKPHYDWIRGLAPTISIEQKAASRNPRSTVGTITEIYDYVRLLWARVGEQRCHECGGPVEAGTPDTIVGEILRSPEGRRFLLLAPLIVNRKGEHREVFEAARAQGFVRVRVDGVVRDLSEPITLKKSFKHYIEVVVDRLAVRAEVRSRLQDSVEAALRVGQGRLIVTYLDGEEQAYSDPSRATASAPPSSSTPRSSSPTPPSPSGRAPSSPGAAGSTWRRPHPPGHRASPGPSARPSRSTSTGRFDGLPSESAT
jgi:excinuclease ABC subunit A